VRLTWRDNATNETGFEVERCIGAGCTSWAVIATVGPRNNTGSVSYVDATVTTGNTYSYRVWAVNGNGRSLAPTNATSATIAAIPPAPTNFTVTMTDIPGAFWRATLNWAAVTNPTSFTIHRATNATFTSNLSTFTASAASRQLIQNVMNNTTYYYRIRANSAAGSSAWTNALPFPIRTGP
jgi:fibronectin type 3 domain-containing protein